jgi:hypothetical protein
VSDDQALFGGGEVVVADAVAGQRTFDGDLVDVVWWGSAGGRLGRGIGVDVIPGQRW